MDMPQDVTLVEAKREYSGPLPAPEHLEHYEKIAPGSAERIIQFMEKEQKHRHSMDSQSLEFQKTEALRGQGLGFIVIILAFACALISASLGYPWLASLFIGGVVVGVVGKFIDGKIRAKE